MSEIPTSPTRDDLHTEIVLEAARATTGLSDYGDMSFVEGLTIFLDDLRHESNLSRAGATAKFHDIVRMLSNRLIFQRDLARHPEILAGPIEKPIVIFGLPRTGTSKLQRMIAADPGVQRLEMWRLLFPAPFPGAEGVIPDPRIAAAEQIEKQLITHFPQVMAGHPMETREPDEEWFLLEMTFESSLTSMTTRAPRHRAFHEERPQANAYAYMKSLLQYLQWQDGGAAGRPWILKSPAHIGQLKTLAETFPDATLVHCHRDPALTIPSLASLTRNSRLMHSDQVDAIELGADFLDFWSRQAERNLADRDLLGDRTIIDIAYEEIRDRPETVIARIYQHAGREITPQAARAFSDYESRRPHNHFGAHSYSLEEFGLDTQQTDTAFANYLNRFASFIR